MHLECNDAEWNCAEVPVCWSAEMPECNDAEWNDASSLVSSKIDSSDIKCQRKKQEIDEKKK